MDRAVPLNAQLSHCNRSHFYSTDRYNRRDGSTSPVRLAASFIQPVPPTWEYTRTTGHYSPGKSGTPTKLKPMSLGGPAHAFKICLFSTKTYDQAAFEEEAARLNAAMAQPGAHHAVHIQVTFIEQALGEPSMAQCPPGTDAVCGFVNDVCSAPVLKFLSEERGVRLLLNRCTGFNNVDMHSATNYGLRVMRVPAYSPESVAEHGIALLMAVNRKTHVAHARCQDKNFDLQGLEGFAMHGKTVVVLGAGNIGFCAAKVYLGFGCRVLYYNRSAKPGLDKLGAEHLPMADPASMERVCAEADVISIHILLNPATFHMLAKEQFDKMQRKPIIINVARGDIIDTEALVEALENGKVSGAGLDVVEGEAGVFFGDHSDDQDDQWANGAKATMQKLLDNSEGSKIGHRCMVTGHQAFLTHDALKTIAKITLMNALDHIDDAHPERTRVAGEAMHFENSSQGHVDYEEVRGRDGSRSVKGPLELNSVVLSDEEKVKAADAELRKLRRMKWKKNISTVKNLGVLGKAFG